MELHHFAKTLVVIVNILRALNDLGFSGNAGETKDFYIEAVKPSSALGDLTVKMTITFPDPGNDEETVTLEDTVRLTSSKITLWSADEDSSDFVETNRLILLTLPSDDHGPQPAIRHRIEIDDPKDDLSTVKVGNTSLTLQRVGNKYRSAEFVGVREAERGVVQANQNYVLSSTPYGEKTVEYTPDAVPGGAATGVPWIVTQERAATAIVNVEEGEETVAALDINGTEANFNYAFGTSNANHWTPGLETDVVLKFQIDNGAVGEDREGGRVGMVLDDGARRWQWHVYPDRLVSASDPVNPATFPYADDFSDEGVLPAESFAVLRIHKGGNSTLLHVALFDAEGNEAVFSLDSATSTQSGLFVSASGDDQDAHIRIANFQWTQAYDLAPVTIFSTRPSQMIGGRTVVYLGSEATIQYNPETTAKPHFAVRTAEKAHEKVQKTIAGAVTVMENTGWVPQPGDDGAFGKQVHLLSSSKLHDNKNFAADVWVRRDGPRQGEIVAIYKMNNPIGHPPATLQQVDLVALKPGYKLEVGKIIDPNKIEVFDIKTIMNFPEDNAKINAQMARIKDATGKDKAVLVRSSKVYRGGKFVTVKNVGRLLKIFGVVMMANQAYAILSYDTYEYQHQAMEDAWEHHIRDVKGKHYAAARLSGMTAVTKTKEYISNFMPGIATDFISYGVLTKKLLE